MSDTANPERGEVSLELDGQSFVLRPSYEAIVAIERQTGKALLSLTMEADQGCLSLADAAIIACECIRADGRAREDQMRAAVNPRRIGELIMETQGGLMFVSKKLQLLLILASTGGYSGTGEVRATAKN